MSNTKLCAGCGRDLPISEFRVIKHKTGNVQLAWKCHACLRAYNAAKLRKYRAANRDKTLASARSSMRKWNAANTEEHRCRVRQWRKENPSKLKALRSNYKAKRKMVAGTVSAIEWQERLAEFNSYCAYCLKPFDKFDVEHMQPVSRGGTHTIENVIPSCSGCNNKKHTKTLLEFAREATSIAL